MNDKDDFQILRDERTKLVNRVADLETENIRLRGAIAATILNLESHRSDWNLDFIKQPLTLRIEKLKSVLEKAV
jgi:hypothetical protein